MRLTYSCLEVICNKQNAAGHSLKIAGIPLRAKVSNRGGKKCEKEKLSPFTQAVFNCKVCMHARVTYISPVILVYVSPPLAMCWLSKALCNWKKHHH